MKTWCTIGMLAALLAGAPALAAEEGAGTRVDGPRLAVTVGNDGLPQQISIKADERYEIPLEARGTEEANSAVLLATLGRGNQLRAPIRFEATADGKKIPMAARAPIALSAKDGARSGSATIEGGGATVELTATYDAAGWLHATASYSAAATVEAIELVIEPEARLSTIIPGNPVNGAPKAHAREEFVLSDGIGVVWSNVKREDAPLARALPGLVPHCFLGNDDRGFTWLAGTDGGWGLDPAVPSMTVLRDKAGAISWRISLTNKKGAKAEKPVSFSLLTHPAAFRPVNALSQAWVKWPKEAAAPAQPALTPETARTAKGAAFKADVATLCENAGGYRVLTGLSGGDAFGPDMPLGLTYPAPLLSYLAGTHTAQVARVVSNARALGPKSDGSGALDRSVIGNALLYGAAPDAATLDNPAAALPALLALEWFGAFADDGLTEYVSPARCAALARYGEPKKDPGAAADPFDTGESSALTDGVSVACYIRPVTPGTPTPRKVLFVIVNNSPAKVRDAQFYILDGKRLFGEGNKLTCAEWMENRQFMKQLKDDVLAPNMAANNARLSTWHAPIIGYQNCKELQDPKSPRWPAFGLGDVEDGGVVQDNLRDTKGETYGPNIAIPANGFRLLYGTGEAPAEKPKKK